MDDDDFDVFLPPLDANVNEIGEFSIFDKTLSEKPQISSGVKKLPIKVTRKRGVVEDEQKKLNNEKRLAAKISKEAEKTKKQRTKNELKAQQPKEALKFMQINVDARLKFFLGDAPNSLNRLIRENLNFEETEILDEENLLLENVIFWTRKDPHGSTVLCNEAEFCLVARHENLDSNENVQNFTNLVKNAQSVLKMCFSDVKLRIVFVGGTGLQKRMFDVFSKVGFFTHHCEPNLDGLAKFLASYTKSVAEKPYKQHKREAEDFLTFAPNSANFKKDLANKGIVEAEKKFTWRLMLRVATGSKPNAEQASKVICDEYPSLNLLLQGYSKLSVDCENSDKRCEAMLQDLVVDPLTRVRIGPAISTAVYRVFTSSDPEMLVS